MAFLAALPEIAEAAGAAGEAGGAAAGAGEAAGGAAEGGMMGRMRTLFGRIPHPGQGEANKQQNMGDSRNLHFQDAANAARQALRGGVD